MEPNNPIKDVRLSFACDKNFDAMTPCGTGRHCDACNKVVIDFTDKTMADYQAALEQNTEVCGHFHISQLAAVTIPNTWMSRIAATMALIVGLGAIPTTLEAQKKRHKAQLENYYRYIIDSPIDWTTVSGNILSFPKSVIYSKEEQMRELLSMGLTAFPDNVKGAINVVFSLDEAGRLFDIVIKESFNPEIDALILVLLTSLCLGGIEKEEDYDPNKRYAYQLNIDNGRIVA